MLIFSPCLFILYTCSSVNLYHEPNPQDSVVGLQYVKINRVMWVQSSFNYKMNFFSNITIH